MCPMVSSKGLALRIALSASFQRHEDGLDHQLPMPDVPPPETLPPSSEVSDPTDPITVYIAGYSSIDLRYAPPTPLTDDGPLLRQPVWFRVREELPDDPLLHVCAAAYASDLTILVTSLLPHGRRPDELMMASLDHAMWFHRPLRADQWLLYDTVSPTASGGRGLASGQIFTHDGTLVASVVQEGLMRVPR